MGTIWPNPQEPPRTPPGATASYPWRHRATLFGRGLVFEHVDRRGTYFVAEVTGDEDGSPGVTSLDVVPRSGTVLSGRTRDFPTSELERAVQEATDGEAARWKSGVPLDWAGICTHGTLRRSRSKRRPSAQEYQVATAVRDLGGGCTTREVARQLSLSRRRANELLRRAEASGEIRCERRAGLASRYWASDAPQGSSAST